MFSCCCCYGGMHIVIFLMPLKSSTWKHFQNIFQLNHILINSCLRALRKKFLSSTKLIFQPQPQVKHEMMNS